MDSIKSDSEKTRLLLWTEGDRGDGGVPLVSKGNSSFTTEEKLGTSRDEKHCRGGDIEHR